MSTSCSIYRESGRVPIYGPLFSDKSTIFCSLDWNSIQTLESYYSTSQTAHTMYGTFLRRRSSVDVTSSSFNNASKGYRHLYIYVYIILASYRKLYLEKIKL